MKVDLREHSLENIRIKDTSLIGGNFVRCNFNGSEFDNVDISGVNLNQAQLFNCKWKNIKIHELNRLDGHEDCVYSVNFSPDGTTLASGSSDNSIRLWDVKTSKEILQSDSSYKDLLSHFKIPLQNSSLFPNVNPDLTILRICQNPLLEASGTLILKGQFINHQGKDFKPIFKSKGSCFQKTQSQCEIEIFITLQLKFQSISCTF